MIKEIKKKAVRKAALETRDEICQEEFTHLNGSLCKFVFSFLSSQSQIEIGFYAAIRSEPDIIPAVQKWLQISAKHQAFLPVTEGKNIRFALWDPNNELKKGRFGVPEPSSNIFVDPHLLLIPCVALNKQGYRLGYGAGYYDRYLSSRIERPRTVGVCFSYFLNQDFDSMPFDVPLDSVITEKGFCEFRKN